MKTILITSQKGGSSKTMLVAHLAVESERAGDAPAWIIDTDRQGTLSRWHERRKVDTPRRGDVRFERLKDGLAKLAGQNAAVCFIDSAPTISTQTATLIDLADFILIPVRPSPADLWSVTETVQMVKAAAKPFLFAITQAKERATITAQAVAALSKHGQVAETFIADRVAYASAMTSGNTAPEIAPKGPAAKEIAGLWAEMKTVFHENVKPAFHEKVKPINHQNLKAANHGQNAIAR
jgi:chromosome partitioning protein